MGEVKEFPNNAVKTYYEVAKGEEDVELSTFNTLYEQLPDVDLFDESRVRIGTKLLSSLRFIEPRVTYYRKDESNFLQDPEGFSMRMIPGEDLINALEQYKLIQSDVNEVYGHYTVCLKLLNFLIIRNRELVKKNNKLIDMYEDIRKELDKKILDNELNIVKVSSLDTQKLQEDILLTNNEKKMPVVELKDSEENKEFEESEESENSK